MNEVIRNYRSDDLEEVIKILNTFTKESFAVYTEETLPNSFIENRLKELRVFLVLEISDKVIGFGFISPYKPFANFSETGVLTYFLLPEYTGKGYGTKLFRQLINEGKERGITNYLAHINSKNEQSLNFHKKLGFEEVGRFKKMGRKFGEYFDIVWVQKFFSGEGN